LKKKLMSQIASLEIDGRGRFPKYPPFAFTETGATLSSVLRSESAILVNRVIIRPCATTFTTTTITTKLAEIRAKLTLLERADEDNSEAVNDLSEDIRKKLDNIYNVIAALSLKISQAHKPSPPRSAI